MNEEIKVLQVVTERLNKANIPYLVSGSMAANYYTVPRMTRDIDIVVELKQKDAGHFKRLFKEDFYLDEKTINDEIQRKGMFNLIHNQHVVKIDFIVHKESEFQDATFHRRRKVSFEKIPLWIISPEDLVLYKLLWAKESHSEMQLKDVTNLLKSVKDLEKEYIEDWVSKLSLSQIYEKVTQ